MVRWWFLRIVQALAGVSFLLASAFMILWIWGAIPLRDFALAFAFFVLTMVAARMSAAVFEGDHG